MTASFDPVRFGILGVGRIAVNRFAPAVAASPLATLEAAASRDLSRAKSIDAARAYGSYEELLRDERVEAVYVATHNGLHEELCLEALDRGKHVLCEKPLGRNAAECERILARAQQRKRHLVEAFMYRHHPQIAKMLELVRGGAIGELRTVEASFSFHLTKEDDVRLNDAWGGGGLLDVGCYCVNICRLLLGDEPVGISARGAFHPVHGVDLALHGILEYEGGRFAVISSGFDGGLRNRVLLSGTRGTLELRHAFLSWEDEPLIVLRQEGGETHYPFEIVDVFRLEVEDLCRAIRTGSQPKLGPDEGLKNARILDALLADARRSARSRG
jgi:predicted dehydrogenase